jgi:hypothetical protein
MDATMRERERGREGGREEAEVVGRENGRRERGKWELVGAMEGEWWEGREGGRVSLFTFCDDDLDFRAHGNH